RHKSNDRAVRTVLGRNQLGVGDGCLRGRRRGETFCCRVCAEDLAYNRCLASASCAEQQDAAVAVFFSREREEFVSQRMEVDLDGFEAVIEDVDYPSVEAAQNRGPGRGLPKLRGAQDLVQLVNEQRSFGLVAGPQTPSHPTPGLPGGQIDAGRVTEDDR